MNNKTYKLMCSIKELQLLGTLNGGQSFRWKKAITDETEEWIGVFYNRVWILKQTEDCITYKVYDKNNKTTPEEYEKLLIDYFQLNFNLEEHYLTWSKIDPYFKIAAKQFYGVRILKQDPVENIFSFICSQNNHISRISSMVEKLAIFYGSKICEIDGITYYTFPEIQSLSEKGVEETLKQNGFGYRAKYINKTAQELLQKGGRTWLDKLKIMNYEDAKQSLITLPGIGPKVADCICLMSLGHLESVPVDTHMYQIATKLYGLKLSKHKTLTEKVYKEIANHFRNLYGPLAGWAHTVLFCADLKKFKVCENTEENIGNTSKRLKC